MAHHLTDAVVDALEALGNWQPPEEGLLVDELKQLLPGIHQLFNAGAISFHRLADTFRENTPVAAVVPELMDDFSGSMGQAAGDDAFAEWTGADADDIDRGENPRTNEGLYNYVPGA